MATLSHYVIWAFLGCAGVVAAAEEIAAPAGPAQPQQGDEDKAPPAVVTTAAVAQASIAQSRAGVANILNPDALIQLDSDIRAATISANFSAREYERYRLTKSLSLHIVEGAQRQAETDATQLNLLKLRLKQTWGDDAPFLNDESRKTLVEALSTGSLSLVRIDFPDAAGERPRNVRVAALTGGTEMPLKELWSAPSGNLAMPGASYFGLIEPAPGLRHLDRARAIADAGEAKIGVIIPQSALIVFAGETWCYVETAPQTFERRKVPLTWPVASGYLVESGFAPGTKVVVRGASTLLSREAEPSGDEEEDDGPSKAKPAAKPKAPPDAPSASNDGDEAGKAAGGGAPGKDDHEDDKAAATTGSVTGASSRPRAE